MVGPGWNTPGIQQEFGKNVDGNFFRYFLLPRRIYGAHILMESFQRKLPGIRGFIARGLNRSVDGISAK